MGPLENITELVNCTRKVGTGKENCRAYIRVIILWELLNLVKFFVMEKFTGLINITIEKES